MRILLTILAALAAGAAAAEDHESFVRLAFAAVDDDFKHTWAFTETIDEDEARLSWRYDPSRRPGERWSLIAVDGREPTARDLEDFGDREDYGAHEEDDTTLADELDIIDFESLELLEETGERRIYSFAPTGDKDAGDEERRFMEQVAGRLSIVKQGLWLESLEMRNEKPIRPATGVRISRFLTRLSFGRLGTDGPVVPMAVDVEIRGRALLMFGFDEKESIRYSDFQYVGG